MTGRYENGKLIGETTLNLLNGEIKKTWHENGDFYYSLSEKIAPEKGRREFYLTKTFDYIGMYREFYENGNLKCEGLYKNGYREGTWKEFSMEGNLINIISYEKGKVITSNNFLKTKDSQLDNPWLNNLNKNNDLER